MHGMAAALKRGAAHGGGGVLPDWMGCELGGHRQTRASSSSSEQRRRCGLSPTLQEMEAAAVAWSADLFACPVFCIKSVTDIVDGERPAQVDCAPHTESLRW